MKYPGHAGMEVVDEAVNFPNVCVFTRDADGPFLDTKTWLNARELNGVDPYAYISVAKATDIGRAVGMAPREDFERLSEQLAAHGERVRELEALLDAYTTIKDAEKVLVGV